LFFSEKLYLVVGGTGNDEPPGITTFSGKTKDRRTLHLSPENLAADVVDGIFAFTDPFENGTTQYTLDLLAHQRVLTF